MSLNPTSFDIARMIEAESELELVYERDLFISEIPDVGSVPDRAVGVFDTPGFAPEANYQYERPTVQVRVRGNRGDYLGTHTLGQAIRNLLNGTANVVLNGARYIGIWASSDVFFVSYDSKHRPIVTVNFRVHRTSEA